MFESDELHKQEFNSFFNFMLCRIMDYLVKKSYTNLIYFEFIVDV